MRAIFTGGAFLSAGRCRSLRQPDPRIKLTDPDVLPAKAGVRHRKRRRDLDRVRFPGDADHRGKALVVRSPVAHIKPVDAAWFGLLFPQLLIERRTCTPQIP